MYTKKVLLSLAVASSLILGGCATTNMSAAAPKVQKLIEKNQLQVVGFDYVEKIIADGTRKNAKAILIDARPAKKYITGTIPSSLNIPDTQYDKYIDQLKDVKKDKEIIVFCGGWKCGKSPKVAGMLKKDGFTNVKLYQAGEPEWNKKSYLEVSKEVVKAAQKKNSAVLIDARPYKKYLGETIPGAIAIPDTKMDSLEGRFPVSKEEKIITFCGGYGCHKSHVVAKALLEKGYKDVSVYAGGMPAWKKAGYATTKSASKAKASTEDTKPKFSKNGIMLGLDEGTVDGEWMKDKILKNEVPSNVVLVNVLDNEDFKKGHLEGSINIVAEKLSAKKLQAKLPEGKSVIFYCASGARSLEAWQKLKDAGMDVSEVFYFDALIECKSTTCKIEVNEPLG